MYTQNIVINVKFTDHWGQYIVGTVIIAYKSTTITAHGCQSVLESSTTIISWDI